MSLSRIISKLKKKDFNISRLFTKFILCIDKNIFLRLFNFNTYYNIQKVMGFPIIKIKFHSSNGYYPSLKNPTSFSEKLTYLKLFSRNPLLPIISDKYVVRNYISKKIGSNYLIPLLQVVTKSDEINYDALPNKFIIKTNFSSGQNIIVFNKDAINPDTISKKLNRWMRMKYRYQELIWFPQFMKRKIIVEELLLDNEGKIPSDYKFYVFQGNVKVINAVTNRFNKVKMSFFNRNWEMLNLKMHFNENETNMPKPNNLNKMISIAEILGKDFDFMRIDLYSINKKIYFGEFSVNPSDGRAHFSPTEYDYKLGSYWDMDLKYINKMYSI